jgi:hypothetical protein
MNDHDFDLTARAWLDDGPTRMSDRAVLSTLEEIHTTRQRRVIRPSWRATPVSNVARVTIAAVLVVGVGLLAISIVPRQPDASSVSGPSPSPSASLALDPADLTTTFVSPRNGFSIRHPDDAVVTPATTNDGADGFDVVDIGAAGVFTGTSIPFANEVGIELTDPSDPGRMIAPDEQIDRLLSDDDAFPGGCGVPRRQQAEITIDGQAGRIAECPNRIEATIATAGWLYVFTLSHPGSDARALFDAVAATIDLTPETAVDVQALPDTFVSPTYGYSFRYMDRGGLAPATELWDPANQPSSVRWGDERYDAVETGFAAYLQSASTPIPDGVSVDGWVDLYVTPPVAGGCGVPRSEQAEITIDGLPGRMAECANLIDATVVAGRRVYLFRLGHDRPDARAFFDTWIATIDLTPETVAPRPSGDGEATASPSEAP